MEQGATATFRRQADTVPRARSLIGRELCRVVDDDDVVDRLVLASAEACNNAILHSDCGRYVVTVEIDTAVCTVTVSDDGIGFDMPEHLVMPSPDSVGHRGLALMDALVDQVTIRSSPEGTTVVLRQHINGNNQRPSG
jgi:anti-sigma regulatory factor (Ser/Thr protein kinase)